MKNLVSVIIPAYNCEYFIRQSIDSIIKQSYNNLELLICDDGSTDGTLKAINTIKDSRIILFHNDTNKGYPFVMNQLMQASKGEYIMIQDADDYSHEKRIETLLKESFKAPYADILGSDLIKLYPDGRKVLSKGDYSFDRLNTSFHQYERPGITFPTIFMRREVAQIQFRDLKFVTRAQDIDWFFRVSEYYKFKIVNEPLYFYRQHDSSMSNSNVTETIYNMFYWKYICYITYCRREKGIDLLEPHQNHLLKEYLDKLIIEKKNQDPVFWERHLAYRAKKNRNIREAIYYSILGILSHPLNYGSYQSLYKVLFRRLP